MTKVDLSLGEEELHRYLDRQRTIRLATSSPDGDPQVVPLWFVWLDGTIFLNSTLGNVTVENIEGTHRAAGIVDDGELYEELRGVLLRGRVERAEDDPRIERVKASWSQKYMGGGPVPYDRWKDRAWFRLTPEDIASWDFRKIPEAKERARSEGG